MRIRYSFWAPALLGLVADLLSKHLIFAFLRRLPEPRRYPLLGSWLVLQLQQNTGGVFGVLPGKSYVFVLLSAVALVAVVWMLRTARPEQRLLPVALGLVVAGAIGNLVDRLWFGYVRDFIYVEVIRWPAFNIADTCICVAAGLLAIEILRDWRREKREGERRS
jgi:signal peptidase II